MSTVSDLAVSITIGTPDSARIALHTSMPFIPGSIRSSSTRSGFSSRSAGNALVPSFTTAVSKPSPRSTIVSISASAGSSSTTSTRAFMPLIVACGPHAPYAGVRLRRQPCIAVEPAGYAGHHGYHEATHGGPAERQEGAGRGEGQADPEAPAEVDPLGVGQGGRRGPPWRGPDPKGAGSAGAAAQHPR